MKRLLVLLTMVMMMVLSACGSAPDANLDVLEAQVVELESQVVELDEYKTACKATVASQDEVITSVIDDLDDCTKEYSVLEDAYNELLIVDPTPVVTVEPTPEPTAVPEIPDLWRYVCGTVTIQRNVFQKQYKASGAEKRNPSGNLILKPVPGTQVKPYLVGDKVCVRFDPFQVDGGRVTLISGTRGSGYFFPMNSFDFVKPYNPNP